MRQERVAVRARDTFDAVCKLLTGQFSTKNAKQVSFQCVTCSPCRYAADAYCRETRMFHIQSIQLVPAPCTRIAYRLAAYPLLARCTLSKIHPTCRSRPTCTRGTSPTSLTRSRRRATSRECQPGPLNACVLLGAEHEAQH